MQPISASTENAVQKVAVQQGPRHRRNGMTFSQSVGLELSAPRCLNCARKSECSTGGPDLEFCVQSLCLRPAGLYFEGGRFEQERWLDRINMFALNQSITKLDNAT